LQRRCRRKPRNRVRRLKWRPSSRPKQRTDSSSAMPANVLSSQTGRSVQDFTGLNGIFDFMLEWAPDGVRQDDAGGGLPSLSTALREQLGLKLESRKGPVEVIVVDRLASGPPEN